MKGKEEREKYEKEARRRYYSERQKEKKKEKISEPEIAQKGENLEQSVVQKCTSTEALNERGSSQVQGEQQGDLDLNMPLSSFLKDYSPQKGEEKEDFGKEDHKFVEQEEEEDLEEAFEEDNTSEREKT